ncbi:hypothetical protein LSTR_LSTR005057 [Laodelphax striatellus]|uniref:Protein FAM89A n=1 Tax=Laodelphax striatellus TaxID=195883 RepID=A0A482WT63_LAOST|nr:hypothetical protein LSTR_LSTR005057 [Laodelphax striatellus]
MLAAVNGRAGGGSKAKPPPVPPRPNKNVIAEAMARNRRTGQHVHAQKKQRPVTGNGVFVNGGAQVLPISGHPVKMGPCRITIPPPPSSDDDDCSAAAAAYRRAITMASLQGLPPLPKSLSGANLLENSGLPEQLRLPHPSVPPPPPPTMHPEAVPGGSSSASSTMSSKRMPPPPPPPRKLTTLDTQLAILRKEMYSLRELDLNLLSQLWSLNESIQEFRQIQEALSPPSPSSDIEDDILYSNLSALPEHHTLSSSSSRSSSGDYRDV